MQLALRKTPPTGATVLQRFFCWLIQWRLVSQYSHGGIVISGVLHHITASHGYQALPPGQWSPDLWDITDLGGPDLAAQAIFAVVSAPPASGWQRWLWQRVRGYDWFSLLAFAGPLVRVSWLNYCFELCYLMRTGQTPTGRITPEILLTLNTPTPHA